MAGPIYHVHNRGGKTYRIPLRYHPYSPDHYKEIREKSLFDCNRKPPPRKRPRLRITPTTTSSLLDTQESVDFTANITFGEDLPPAGGGGGPPPRVTITYLKQHLDSLTHRARKGEYDDFIGHEDTLRKMMHGVLAKKSIVLSGPAGRGKQTLVRMLARQLSTGPIPPGCQNQYIMELDVEELMESDDWLDLFKQRIDECLMLKSRVILSLPKLSDLTHWADSREALAYLKEKMNQGLRIIATANTNSKKPLFGSLEDQVLFFKIPETDRRDIQKALTEHLLKKAKEEALTLLRQDCDKVEARFDIRIEDEAIEAALEICYEDLTTTELKEGRLYQETKKWLERAVTELLLRVQEKPKHYRTDDEPIPQVDSELICSVMAMWEGGTPDDFRRYSSGLRLKEPLKLEDRLRMQVVGQDEAVESVSSAILTMVSGLKDETAPIGTFLFLGPTGVGKTELAKAVARELFGSENDMIRIDMSEYQEKHTVSRLIGSPPGYVGYDKGGQLTEAVRKKPYSVVLLDEIEKAHPDVLKVFLQVFDEGRLTDGKGKTVDFRNCLFILTSNLKSAEIGKLSGQGVNPDEILAMIQPFLIKTLSPELFNRLDSVIPFHHISQEILDAVCPMMLKRLAKDVKNKINVKLTWTPEVLAYLGKHGYSPDLGLRPLKRLVTKSIRTIISRGILTRQFARGDRLELYVENGTLKVRKVT